MPYFFPSDNDIKHGELTFNFVEHGCRCGSSGLCPTVSEDCSDPAKVKRGRYDARGAVDGVEWVEGFNETAVEEAA